MYMLLETDRRLSAYKSSHYAQAHALLNLQLIHSVVGDGGEPQTSESQAVSTGFSIYSPLNPGGDEEGNPEVRTDFTAGNLLTVSERLLAENSLQYFALCRELGARAVDGLIRGESLSWD